MSEATSKLNKPDYDQVYGNGPIAELLRQVGNRGYSDEVKNALLDVARENGGKEALTIMHLAEGGAGVGLQKKDQMRILASANKVGSLLRGSKT